MASTAPSSSLVVHLTNQSSLAVVEIAISSLTFLISSFATIYKGYLVSNNKGAGALLTAIPRGIFAAPGFFWLSTSSLLHIIGSACYVSQEIAENLMWPANYLGDALTTNNPTSPLPQPDTSKITVYACTTFVTVAPLLLASLAFSQFTGAATSGTVGRVLLGLIQLLPIAGFALGIAGGAKYDSASASDVTLGQSLLQASAILFLVALVALVCLTAVNISFVRSLRTLAIAVAMPFLAVRVIYDILLAFSGNSGFYDFDLPDLSVQIFMRTVMEYAIVLLFLFTGLGAMTNLGDAESQDEEANGSIAGGNSKDLEESVPLTPINQAHQRPQTHLD
ncbi:hypothetical protein AMS68_001496 [Peltaster fructicola]|uniref:DUF7702 domain-containing protein n=1 Tax=Peltaster fructicola TaxID=286661 RepID=A0A6H0XMY0_9PEZI|nr:hypothetical protein AMS68_001496 [Peltaster fructicola]